MATEKKWFIKYKSVSGKLQEHFGFKLLVDHNIKNADQVYCILSDKSFAYHESNRLRIYHLKQKHSLQYSKFQLAKSALFSQLINAQQKF